jgi:hypothetical protein
MDSNAFWLVVPSLLIGLLGWIVTNIRDVRIARRRMELQHNFIDKMLSCEQTQSYLLTPEGRRFLAEIESGERVLDRVLRSVHMGIILCCLALALAGWSMIEPALPPGLAILVGGLGIGFLAASAVTYRLRKAWGLLSQAQSERDNLDAR